MKTILEEKNKPRVCCLKARAAGLSCKAQDDAASGPSWSGSNIEGLGHDGKDSLETIISRLLVRRITRI